MSNWFDDAWVAKNAAAITRDHTAHHVYRWLAAPMLVGRGGETRLLALAESLGALTEAAAGAPWQAKLQLLIRRLKAYTSRAHDAFFDVEFEVLQLARVVTSTGGATLRDIEHASGNGFSVDALLSLDDRDCYVEFKALEPSEEAQSFGERSSAIFARLQQAIGVGDGWEVKWRRVPTAEQVETFARFIELERDQLRHESALAHEIAVAVLRDGSMGMGWCPDALLSRRRIRKRLKHAWQQLRGCRPALVKMKLQWTDDVGVQVDEIDRFLEEHAGLDAVIVYGLHPLTPTVCLVGDSTGLSESELTQLA